MRGSLNEQDSQTQTPHPSASLRHLLPQGEKEKVHGVRTSDGRYVA